MMRRRPWVATVNVLVAADSVLVPISVSIRARRRFKLLHTTELLKKD
jgi:hypothetical protein